MRAIAWTSIGLLVLLPVQKVWAVCPICTLAAGAGIGVARWLGIDDAITGLWVGGAIVSLIFWTEAVLEARNIRFAGRAGVVAAAYLGMTVFPLYLTGMIGAAQNSFGDSPIDKLLWGMIAGSAGFWCGASWYFYLKEKHGGHAYFPFQKVAMPIAPLLLLSLVFFLLG